MPALSQRHGLFAAGLYALFTLTSFGAGAAFLSYPGKTPGLAAVVTHQTPALALTVDSSNDGDWRLAFGGTPFDQASGVLIATAYPDFPNNDIGASGSPGRAFVEVAGRYTEDVPVAGFADGWLALTDVSGGGSEANFNLGLVYFPCAEGWTAATVARTGEIRAGNSTGLTVVADANDAGRWELSLTSVDARTDGLLFVIGGDNNNSGNTVSTEVRPDGSGWDIISYDQGGTFLDNDADADGDGGQAGSFHFVYVPYATPDLVGGWIDDDGSMIDGVGSFTASRLGTGRYLLQLSDGAGGFLAAEDGVIITTVAKGASLSGPALDPDDNFLEVSYDAAQQGWVVRSFDLPNAGAQDTEFVFAFCAFATPLALPEPPPVFVIEDQDFRLFTQETHAAISGFSAPNWTISADGRTAAELNNSFSTMLVSPAPIIDKVVRGFVTPGSDDDLVGLVIGVAPGVTNDDSADYLLLSWKGVSQTFDFVGGLTEGATPGGSSPVGLSLSRVQGVPNHDEIWQRADLAGSPRGGVTQLSRGLTLGSTGYNRAGGSHYLKVEYTAAAVRIYVDGVLQFDVPGTYAPAHFGVWEMTQSPGATFANFTVADVGSPEPGTENPIDLGDTPNPPATPSPANPSGLRAYVWEYADSTTGRAGAAELLRRAGFHVEPLPLDRPPYEPGSDPEGDVDLIFIGSYVSDSPAYSSYMTQYADVLDDYIDRAGLLVQMAQRASLDARPAFLPDTQDARRGSNTYTSARVLSASNPLLADVPTTGSPAAVTYDLPAAGDRIIAGAYESFFGFEVILAGDPIARFPALMEGAYGQGRFLLSAMTFDKIIDTTTRTDVSAASLRAFNAAFFANLYAHAKNVDARTIPELNITPAPGESALADGAWTLVLVPDTQIYSQNYPGVFLAQTSWILDNARKRNVRYALHLGDIVNVNSVPEWKNARAAFDILHGRVPYAFVPGNHDYGPGGNAATRDTYMNDYLPYARYADWPSFGGGMEPGKMDNTYHLFEAGGVSWIVMCLEWGPRDSTIAWADSILRLHPQRKAILVTHAYMNNNDLRYDISDTANPQDYNPHRYSTPGPVNDGEQLWQKLVRKHNFVLTVNGHVLGDGTGYRVDLNDAGQPVHQMLVNYQFRNLGGEGYLRTLEFQPNGRTVRVSSYSPIYNNYLLATDQTFEFTLPLAAADQDGDGVLDYYDESFDDDGDGLNNYLEYVLHGTSTALADTDGDGLGDGFEITSGTDPLRDDRRVVRSITDSPQLFGLYTESMIRDVRPGDLLLRREGGAFELKLQLEGSSSPFSGTWTPVGAPATWTVPDGGEETFFFRVRLKE